MDWARSAWDTGPLLRRASVLLKSGRLEKIYSFAVILFHQTSQDPVSRALPPSYFPTFQRNTLGLHRPPASGHLSPVHPHAISPSRLPTRPAHLRRRNRIRRRSPASPRTGVHRIAAALPGLDFVLDPGLAGIFEER